MPHASSMDEFENVDEPSFVEDSEEDNAENDVIEDHAPEQLPQPQPTAPEHQALSQDHDFQSQVPLVMRPRVGPAQENIPEPRPQNVDTENGRDGSVKCPECNHPTKRKDIRRIWSKSVIVVDTAEKDEAVVRAKKEQEQRIRCEQDLAQSRLAFQMLKSEMTKLQQKHDRQRAFKIKYRNERNLLKLTNPSKDIARRFSYLQFKTIPLPSLSATASSYMSFRQDEEMLVFSRQANDIHGIAKISLRDFSSNLQNIIPVHSQAIRDVQCYTNDPVANKSLVLTASMDKTLKVTSAASQHVVLSYDLKAPVWSCCWSNASPFTIYCAIKAKQTSILTLDLRNTKGPVASFSQTSLLGHSPIHSMIHIAPSMTVRREGILCGNLEGAFIYNFEANTVSGTSSQESIMNHSQSSSYHDHSNLVETGQERRIPFRVQGASCSSVSFDTHSRHWMASYKFLGKPFTQHIRGHLDQDAASGDLVLKSEFKVLGGPPVPSMARTSVFSRQDGTICMAAGSEGATHIWYGTTEQPSKISEMESSQPPSADALIERLVLQSSGVKGGSRPELVKDVKPIVVGGREYLATLSDRQAEFYLWSEEARALGGDELTEDSSSGEDSEDAEGSRSKRRRIEGRVDRQEAAEINVVDIDDD
ncbi:RING finger and WD repeat domain-containing protein 3 [Dissophora globulifera]|uniref:RING-type E3 ubiquitin transferase n=1 Tax=Dissophora globulifera TaxID=979702 RepID=A0A9P6RXR0_9FUNG|nr:RING finger and WD repeat domain-containing protein 3 [Dissophora globulifera]